MNCEEINDCAIMLPNENDKSPFQQLAIISRKERVPFVVYADLKYILEKTDPRAFQDKRVFIV